MRYAVHLAESAARDIEDIYEYVARNDSQENADRILRGIEAACQRLGQLPLRGNIPKELRAIGIGEYREAHFKPYRIVYRITAARVIVYAVLDGRRDMQTLLQQRLVR